MSDYKSMLCIGGPRDGERFAVRSGSGFTVPVLVETALPIDPTSPDYQPNKPVQVNMVGYCEQTFHTPQGDVTMWVPERQTPLETITRLLSAYEQRRAQG